MPSAWWGRSQLKPLEEAIELRPLLQEVARGRAGGFLLEGEVHAFVAAVLLRVPGPDAFDGDAEPQPPHRELAEPEEAVVLAKGMPLSVRIARGRPPVRVRIAVRRDKRLGAGWHKTINA